MSHPSADLDHLDPESQRLITKVRRLMLIALFTTMVAIAGVLGVIGYRVSTLQGSGPASTGGPMDILTELPKGARVIATAAAGDRIVVTIDVAGEIEIRTFDLRTLAPTGRLQLKPKP
jgi:hypothetical protein